MKRRIIIALSILGVLVVILAVAVASIGTELDQTRIDRDELQFQAGGLQDQVDSLSGEREKLKTQVDEQLKTIEQLKADLERNRNHTQESPAVPSAPEPPPSTNP